MLGNESHAVYFARFRGRLAQIRTGPADVSSWEQRWDKSDIDDWLKRHSDGKLDDFEQPFLRFLPRDLPILEAGCGRGQLVAALQARSYDVHGVDYALRTVARIHQAAPELAVRVGDVYRLDVADGAYGGYISIGVFEHDPEGPLEGLREAARVLHPDGHALITVPYLNRARRRWLKRLPEPATNIDSTGFYQYYFSRSEFETLLSEAGLETLEVIPYATHAGLTRDHRLGRWLHHRRFFFWFIERRFARWCRDPPDWALWRWAHMLMFICRRRR